MDYKVRAEARIFRRVQTKEVGGGLDMVPSPCWLISVVWRVSHRVQNIPVQENDYDTSISSGEELDQGWKMELSGSLRVRMLLRTTAMSQLESWSETWQGLREQMRLCSLA